jgi:hypothetical protein
MKKNSAIEGIAARKKGLVSNERVLLRAGVITGEAVTTLQSYVKELCIPALMLKNYFFTYMSSWIGVTLPFLS